MTLNDDRGLLARVERVARVPARASAVAVAAPLVLQRRDLRLGLGELLLVLFQEGCVGRAAGGVEAAVVSFIWICTLSMMSL